MYGNAPRGGRKWTAPQLRARKASRDPDQDRIAMVTAYDFTMARLVDEAEVDMILVGDSLGMIVQGRANTLPVTLDEMIYHTRAVARGAETAHVVGDLPFMSYQVSPAQAVESAGRLVKEGDAESVKLEGGETYAEHVRQIVRAGIPVVGHVGLTPQSVHALGGFKVQGRGDAAAHAIVRDALALEAAGAFAIVLEAIPPDVAEAVTRAVSVPTIGIGAGAECDGQVLVCTDLLGMTRGRVPKFTKQFAPVGDAIVQAMRAYRAEVQSGAFPAPEHAYRANNAPPKTKQPEESGERLAYEIDSPLALDVWN